MPNIGNYKLQELIGKGSFGQVYKGIHKETNELVAVKLERKKETNTSKLFEEADFLKNLKKNLNCPYVPGVLRIGTSQKWNYMIMDYLGPSLEELFTYCSKQFTLKTTLMLAEQILSAIHNIHKNGIVHRDIKPDNFLIGYGKTHKKIFLIDFGLSKTYINSNTFQHEEYNQCKQFTGSFRYSSIYNHKGIEQSRRDDLESIGYMLIFFLKGKLPWQNMPGKTKKEKLKNTYEKKVNTTFDELCQDCPRQFRNYIQYCRRLRYMEKPDYFYLKNLFRTVMKQKRYKNNHKYDWDINKEDMYKTIKIHKNKKFQSQLIKKQNEIPKDVLNETPNKVLNETPKDVLNEIPKTKI
jgi:serine/threonine protein kinase